MVINMQLIVAIILQLLLKRLNCNSFQGIAT